MQIFRLYLTFSLLLILIIGSGSFLNMALSKSSWNVPLLISGGISVNGGTASSNLNDLHNWSFSTSRPYFAHLRNYKSGPLHCPEFIQA
jgi:hypothetical protein